jgi:acyl-CoA thioesterase
MTMSGVWELDELFEIFDVERVAADRFRAASLPPRFAPEDQVRAMVEGSQILGQALVAARRAESDRFVKSAHMIFARPVSTQAPLELALDGLASGRSFSSLSVRAMQGDRTCAQGLFLLDNDAPDCIRHDPPMPGVAGPEDSERLEMPVVGRDVRIVEGADFAEPDAVGPPALSVWVRYERAPEDPAIRQAVIASLCGPFTIGTAMRPHAGFGQNQAHHSLSTGVLSLSVHFHAASDLDGWLLYEHDALHAGRGLCDGKGRIFEQSGRLVASFEQEALLRPLPSEVAAAKGSQRVL